MGSSDRPKSGKAMSDKERLKRMVRGRRPEFYPTAGMDQAMSMIMVLAQEFTVMHDRMDTIERIAASKNIVLPQEIEDYAPDQSVLEAREIWRQEFFERLFYLLHQQAAEAAEGDNDERFEETLTSIAAQ
jgi:hypothetical protein